MSAAPIRILSVLGTRPEAVKLLPLHRVLSADERFEARLISTGQHREMLDQILEPFGVRPDETLEWHRQGQSLNELVGAILPRLDALFARYEPDVVVVQGDTSSGFAAALAAFHRRVRVAHLEAGLRSHDRFHPYPEESNRRMISAVADWHLAPTGPSRENLLREGVPPEAVTITGNTGIDTLLLVLEKGPGSLPEELSDGLREGARRVLLTLHRRESWSERTAAGRSVLEEILEAVARSAAEAPDVDYVYPVHRNPRVREPVEAILGSVPNVLLVEPLPYLPFVALMASATLIITDSGGIQEEAPSLGVPVLVLRETTERPEGVACGANRLVGTDPAAIERAIRDGLAARAKAERSGDPSGGDRSGLVALRPNPFGDGRAAERSRDALLHWFGRGPAPRGFESASSSSRLARETETS